MRLPRIDEFRLGLVDVQCRKEPLSVSRRSTLSITPPTKALLTLAPSLVITNEGSYSPAPSSGKSASMYS